MIQDHVFRGLERCIYPVPGVLGGEDFRLCEEPEVAHKASLDSTSDATPSPPPHWFIGLRSCLGCRLGFDHPAHYLSPSRVKLVGLR